MRQRRRTKQAGRSVTQELDGQAVQSPGEREGSSDPQRGRPEKQQKPGRQWEPEWWTATKGLLLPGGVICVLFFISGHYYLAGVSLVVMGAFLAWVLYYRCGRLAQINYKRGVSFNLRYMKEHSDDRNFQIRCMESLRVLVDRKGRAQRVVERGGVSSIVAALNFHHDDTAVVQSAIELLLRIAQVASTSGCKSIIEHWPPKDVSAFLRRNVQEEQDAVILETLKLIGALAESVDGTRRAAANSGSFVAQAAEVWDTLAERQKSDASEDIHEWALFALYNLQHQCDPIKLVIAKEGIHAILAGVRRHRKSRRINRFAAVLLCELLFEHLEQTVGQPQRLRFLPDAFADAVDAGVMQALHDMQRAHQDCPEIFQCIRLLQSELAKDRKPFEGRDGVHVEMVEM